jgi:hypothetical protein
MNLYTYIVIANERVKRRYRLTAGRFSIILVVLVLLFNIIIF